MVQIIIFDIFKIIIIGKIKAISTSKIKKIIVIKKNCIENGIRELVNGSNPHSNGEVFSRSLIDFLDKIEVIIMTIIEIIKIIILIKKINKIIYTKIIRLYGWKPHILNYII